VHAWSNSGNGTESNLVTCRIPPTVFYGPNGILYGGNKTALFSSIGISNTAGDLLYALLIILLLAGLFALFMPDDMKIWGAVVGAIGGLFVATAFQMISPYALFFLFIIVGAIYLVIHKMTNNGGE
jgi:hypothetical protein